MILLRLGNQYSVAFTEAFSELRVIPRVGLTNVSSESATLAELGSFVTATTAAGLTADRLNERLTSSATWKSVPGSAVESFTRPARYRMSLSSSGVALRAVPERFSFSAPVSLGWLPHQGPDPRRTHGILRWDTLQVPILGVKSLEPCWFKSRVCNQFDIGTSQGVSRQLMGTRLSRTVLVLVLVAWKGGRHWVGVTVRNA